jgi:alpha-1,3-mannosyltransferase
LLGARREVVEDAALVLAYRYPRHRIAGFHSGYFPKSRTDQVVGLIREAKANVLLVAMGGERQEIWIAENFERTGAVLAFGVGAFFDFTAHRFPRAPRLVRTIRSEWIWRLMWEPERLWKRYTVGNATFLAFAAKDAFDHRHKRTGEARTGEAD